MCQCYKELDSQNYLKRIPKEKSLPMLQRTGQPKLSEENTQRKELANVTKNWTAKII